MMLPNSELIARIWAFELLDGRARRPTAYAIKNTLGDLWLAENGKWLAREHALRFPFMTTALFYAEGLNARNHLGRAEESMPGNN